MDDERLAFLKDGLRRKLEMRNQMLQERKKLIEEKVSYDDFTISVFKQFVVDFQKLYPGILSDEEIWNRVTANVKKNIRLVSTNRFTDGSYFSGAFRTKEHEVLLYAPLVEDGVLSSKARSTLFHELVHAMVVENPYDTRTIEEYSDHSNFILESIVTIMEEDFVQKILGEKVSRVNGYIPTYARELNCVFGKDFIKEYILKFRNLEDLFGSISKNDFIGGYNIESELTDQIDSIYYAIREKDNDVNITYKNYNIELGITVMLQKCLEKNSLSDIEIIQKVIDLSETQFHVDFSLYHEILEKYIQDKSLIWENDYLKLLYTGDEHSLDDLDYFERGKSLNRLLRKLKDYQAFALFGGGEAFVEDEEMFELPIYEEEKFLHFQTHKKLYEALSRFVSTGELEEKDLEIQSLEVSVDPRSPLFNLREEIGNGTSHGVVRLRDTLKFGKNIYHCVTPYKDYFVVSDFDNELLEKRFPLEVIREYQASMEGEVDTATREAYMLAIETLQKLMDEGVDEVYASGSSVLYERDGKYTLQQLSSDVFEDEKEHGSLTNDEVSLLEVPGPISSIKVGYQK